MKVIAIEAHDWLAPSDFYDSLLSALGAPGWHGQNVNALIDSIIHGDINEVEPPFRVEVSGLREASSGAAAELAYAFAALGSEGAEAEVSSGSAWLAVRET